MKKQLYILILLFQKVSAQVDHIDLSGSWNFALDSLDIGKKNKQVKKNQISQKFIRINILFNLLLKVPIKLTFL